MSTPENNERMDESRESIPAKGMIFASVGDAENFYRDYARGRGFSTKKGGSYKTQRGNVYTRVWFCCSCEGKSVRKIDSNGEVVNKRYSTTIRCGCKAMMRISLEQGKSSWKVTEFRDQHTHPMVTPSQRRYLHINTEMQDAARDLTGVLSGERIQTGKVPLLFGGSSPSGGFDSKDVYNHMRKTLFQSGDVHAVLDLFTKKSVEDPGFTYAAQADEEGRIVNFFWADARSRMAYSRFGEAVTFDTTYRTNKYSVPFAPFTGLNHHHQSVMFGFALIQHETEKTFVWLFKSWLEAMGGRPPISILTNQDQAMTNAIQMVFPTTRHRFCLWHIKKKFEEKLSNIFFKESDFKKRVKQVIRKSYTVEDFEEGWLTMLVDFELEDHEWLKLLYSIKEKWIPVYNRGTFFAGMNTTQRRESINAFFDGFVNSQTSLLEFIVGCDRALNEMYDRERTDDSVSTYKQRIFSSLDQLLQHASKIYTHNIFLKLEKEFNRSWLLKYDVTETDGDEITCRVTSRSGTHEDFVVRMNKNTYQGLCSCQKFTFVGLPCRHLHLILSFQFGLPEIPPYFVKARWLKDANRSKVVGSLGVVIPEGIVGSDVLRISHFFRRLMELTYILGPSEKGFNVAMEHLNKAFEEVNRISIKELAGKVHNDSQADGSQPEPSQVNASQPGIVILDPHVSPTKGRKTDIEKQSTRNTPLGNVRIPSGMKESQRRNQKRPRTCSYCKGEGHDKRNCPIRKSDQQSSVATQHSGTGPVKLTDLTRDDGGTGFD